jgi:hypothetical protein
MQRFGYETVAEHGMVDAHGFLRRRGCSGNLVDLFRIHGERFFYEDVAAFLERRDRQLCVSAGRSQNMNCVNSLIYHSIHRGEDFRDAKPGGKSGRARLHNVGDSNNLCVWYSLDCAGVKFTYVAGTNQTDA